MKTIVHDPTDGIYASTSDYVHAMEVRNPGRLLCVAGTMGLHPTGAAGTTISEQLDLIWDNLRVILASAEMTVDNIVRVTTYLRDRAYSDANAQARVAALNGRTVPTTAIVVETLVDEWLAEIEVMAAA